MGETMRVVRPIVGVEPRSSQQRATPFVVSRVTCFVPTNLRLLFQREVFRVSVGRNFAIVNREFSVVRPLNVLRFLFREVHRLLHSLLHQDTQPYDHGRNLSSYGVEIFTTPRVRVKPRSTHGSNSGRGVSGLFVPSHPFYRVRTFRGHASSPSYDFYAPTIAAQSPFYEPRAVSAMSFPCYPISAFYECAL